MKYIRGCHRTVRRSLLGGYRSKSSSLLTRIPQILSNDLTPERTVKAWSLIDFMFAELRADPKESGEKAFQKVFTWSLEELDARWKEFARQAY